MSLKFTELSEDQLKTYRLWLTDRAATEFFYPMLDEWIASRIRDLIVKPTDSMAAEIRVLQQIRNLPSMIENQIAE